MTVTNDDDPPDRVLCLQCGTLIERQKFRPTGAVVCPYCHRCLALSEDGTGTVNAPRGSNAPDKSAETYRRPARPLKITLPLPREEPAPLRGKLPLPNGDPIHSRPRRRTRKLMRAAGRGLRLLASTRSAAWLTAVCVLIGGFVFLVLGLFGLMTLEQLVSVFRR